MLSLGYGCSDDGFDELSSDNSIEVETDKDSSTEEEGVEGDYVDVNRWSDEAMLERYLYNEEYATMTRDLSLDYDEFLSSTLSNMTTNVLDNKVSSSGSSEIFTYITREYNTKALTSEEDKSTVGYGSIYSYFTTASILSSSSIYLLSFESFYPDSPISKAGITRSDIFYMVNGTRITASNINTLTSLITNPSLGDELELTDIYNNTTYTLSAESYLTNPILNSQIIEKDGGVKVGYMNMSRFDILFEDEMLAQLTQFKEAGITEFILDLRSNLGGYIYTSNQLIGCIASITSFTPLIYRRYNADMTQFYSAYSYSQTGLYYDDESELFYEPAYTSSKLYASHLTGLSNKRIYCLTSINTASASEIVINCLRGIGFDVITVGSTSRGKNVGSEELTYTSGDYTYSLYPIMMQIYNAKLESDYSAGFTPEASNIVYESYPFYDFGEGEPLFNRAMELIVGESVESRSSLSSDDCEGVATRSGSDISIVRMTPQIFMEASSDVAHGAIDIVR